MGGTGLGLGGILLGGITKTLILGVIGFGYLILTLAHKGDKSLRKLGYFIGSIMILVSTVMLVFSLVFSAVSFCKVAKKGKMMFCPQISTSNSQQP